MYLITKYIYIYIGHIIKIYDEYMYIYLTHYSSLQKRMKISNMTPLNRSFGRFGFDALKSWLWP